MVNRDDLIVQSLYMEIMNGLTPSGRKLLAVLLRGKEDRGLTRQEIARMLGKPKLNRYDIQLLKQLENKRYIVVRRKQLYDGIGTSTDAHIITPPTWNYVYWVNGNFRPYFDEITRRMTKGKTAQPDKVPLFQRLRDLIS